MDAGKLDGELARRARGELDCESARGVGALTEGETCVGVGAPAGALPAPGVVRGKGKKEGHSPTGKPGCLPILYQVLKSRLPMIIVSNVVRRHSPAGVFHAVEGSRPVLLTIGLTAYTSFVQLVCSGSVGSAGTAIAKLVPPGQLSLNCG